MAENEITTPTMAAERLALLQRVCRGIAGDIDTARTVLRAGAEEANTAYLVADALDRIGWMAERAFRIAGDTAPGHAGDADGWMFGPDAQGDIATLLPVEVNHG